MVPISGLGQTVRGIVLAGGKSSRFGQDKALAMFNGATFLETTVQRLREVMSHVTVITNHTRDYSYLGLDCDIRVDKVDEKGPLGGLYTACQLYPDETLLVVVCDMPSIIGALLKELICRHREQPKMATVCSIGDGSLEPFPGVYESRLLPMVKKRIAANKLSLGGLLEEILEINVVRPKMSKDIFVNINREQDLHSLYITAKARR